MCGSPSGWAWPSTPGASSRRGAAGRAAPRQQPARRGPSRRARRQALLAGLLLLVVVPALKSLSHSSCPWSLQGFGGSAPWVSHWDWTLRDGGPGHCFPSGHTAGAAAFAPFAWIWGRRAWGLVALSTGLASLAQLARGAHFLSHVLWAVWICVALGWGLLRLMDGVVVMRGRVAARGMGLS